MEFCTKQIQMQKVFIINGGQHFAHSGGRFNKTVTGWTVDFLKNHNVEIRITDINEDFDPLQEAEHYKWADLIIYHIPIWWFQIPNRMKLYLDEVFTAGHNNGIYRNDGRSRSNPAINYGTGGLLHGTSYMVTTSWNAPDTAFTLKGEFFNQTSVDDGVLFGFHKAMEFTGMKRIAGFHFHDMEKNVTPERIEIYKQDYRRHLETVLLSAKSKVAAM